MDMDIEHTYEYTSMTVPDPSPFRNLSVSVSGRSPSHLKGWAPLNYTTFPSRSVPASKECTIIAVTSNPSRPDI